MEENLVAVVIPVYKEKLSESENISLNRCKKVFKDYPKVLIAPTNLNLDRYFEICSDLEVVRFEKKYFDDIKGYNRLMLSSSFYQQFVKYKYILIHQLDVFIFGNELKDWCNRNYDYIGAPWFNDGIKIFLKIIRRNSIFNALKLLSTKKLNYKSGNGGLSLRKVQSCLECLSIQEKLVSNWEQINEDIFWSFFSIKNGGEFNIPDFRTALQFAIEKKPRKAFKLNECRLPFGVHAWEKWDKKFWDPYIKKREY